MRYPADVALYRTVCLSNMHRCRKSIVGFVLYQVKYSHNNWFLFSRKSCVLLDDVKLKTLNYEILTTMGATTAKSEEGLRSVAYLYAMQHGARHIFDAYPETYVTAQVELEAFKREMHHQLQSLALNVALGLVSERPYVKRVQNPYAHFGRPDLWTEGFRRNNQRYIHNHIYRICEVRPPSMEKVKTTIFTAISVF